MKLFFKGIITYKKVMKLLPLLLTVFIDSMGFGLVFPIFSPLLINNETGLFSPETSLAVRGLIFGIMVSTFCFGQFLGGPLLGALSDRIGRKKVLVASMWLSVLGYLAGSFGIILHSITTLFLARLIGGVAAGSFAVAQSVVVDGCAEEEKAKNLGLVSMAWGVGFVIGPFMGGKLATISWVSPFMGAALLCLVSGILLLFYLKESLPQTANIKTEWSFGISKFRKIFATPSLRGVFTVMFIFCLGWGFFTEFSPVFLMKYLQFDVSQIANFYAWVGLWIALGQGLFMRPLLKRVPPQYLLPISLLGLGMLLPVFLFLKEATILYWILPFIGFSQALIFPTAATLVSNASSKKSQGEMLGINNSIQWAAIAIPPLFSGTLVALFPHLPVTVGSGCMLIAFFVCLWISPSKLGQEEEEL